MASSDLETEWLWYDTLRYCIQECVIVLHNKGFLHLQVNHTDVTNMGHTEVVNLVRAAPRVVDLVVGRVLEAPKPPIEAHLLPDICFRGSQQPLGKT